MVFMRLLLSAVELGVGLLDDSRYCRLLNRSLLRYVGILEVRILMLGHGLLMVIAAALWWCESICLNIHRLGLVGILLRGESLLLLLQLLEVVLLECRQLGSLQLLELLLLQSLLLGLLDLAKLGLVQWVDHLGLRLLTLKDGGQDRGVGSGRGGLRHLR